MIALPNLDDRRLVARARAGDRAAFAVLVDRHYRALLGSCHRMLGDADLARDAAQEATVRALLSLEKLRVDRRFGSWLIGIGLNVCRGWLTGGERRVVLLDLATVELSSAVTGDDCTVDLVIAEELATRVRAAIARLPVGQREAVIRFYLLGLTHAEIAAELNTGSGAVKTRLKKARETLRTTLKDTYEEHITMSDETPAEPQDPNELIPVRVSGLRRTAPTEPGLERHIIFLQGSGGERLPIWIGMSEATTLALILEGIEMPRPGAHQFAASLLAGAGHRVSAVHLTDLTAQCFYAQVILDHGTTVDARPSDAITLALLTQAPISVRNAVFTEADRLAGERDDLIAAAEAATDDQGVIAADALAVILGEFVPETDTAPQDRKVTVTDALAHYKAALTQEARLLHRETD